MKLLDQAEEFQRLLDEGVVKRRAQLARHFGLSRARVTQLLNLLSLHPAILMYVRSLPSGTPPRLVTERKLRRLTRLPLDQQISVARVLLPGITERK